MTASRYDLLPPNATTLERDLSRVTSSLVRAGAPVPTIRTAKRVDIPDSVVPWLVFEYGLAEILPYLTDQRAAIEGGVQWQRIRGTPAAILQALGWLNLNGEIDESEGGSYRWAEFQIGLDAPTSGEAIISQITAVARLSAPVRSRLQRIYSVYDFRRFVLDDSLLSDGAILSDHSGVRPRPGWPQISYGDHRSSSVNADFTVVSGGLSVIGIEVSDSNRFILDHSLMDEEWHVLNGDGARTEYLPTTASRFDAGTNWSDQLAWGDFPWEGTAYLVSSKITTMT
jgi:P2-related tail formation protein